MNVKGGLAYVDFNYNEVSTTRTYIVKGIYSYFDNAYNSNKIPVLRNMMFSGVQLNDTVVTSIRKKSNSDYIVIFRLAATSGVAVLERYITIGSDDTVSVAVLL